MAIIPNKPDNIINPIVDRAGTSNGTTHESVSVTSFPTSSSAVTTAILVIGDSLITV